MIYFIILNCMALLSDINKICFSSCLEIMEGGKKVVPPPQTHVYSSTIVPPMVSPNISESSLSSTLSAAISSYSSAGNYLHLQ